MAVTQCTFTWPSIPRHAVASCRARASATREPGIASGQSCGRAVRASLPNKTPHAHTFRHSFPHAAARRPSARPADHATQAPGHLPPAVLSLIAAKSSESISTSTRCARF
eukprot:366130-Chlamydomonas_euryale.AAC.58